MNQIVPRLDPDDLAAEFLQEVKRQLFLIASSKPRERFSLAKCLALSCCGIK